MRRQDLLPEYERLLSLGHRVELLALCDPPGQPLPDKWLLLMECPCETEAQQAEPCHYANRAARRARGLR